MFKVHYSFQTSGYSRIISNNIGYHNTYKLVYICGRIKKLFRDHYPLLCQSNVELKDLFMYF